MFGGPGDDTQYSGAGDDRIFANGGQDHSYGGEGNDDLWALMRADVTPGPNGEVDQSGDALDGGPGNDRFHTRDGEVDHIACGDGFDVALLDTVDVIDDATAANPNGSCEKVVRSAPRPTDATEPSGGRDPQEPPDH
jgi:Ca2+-binding RTX toxin-like protein